MATYRVELQLYDVSKGVLKRVAPAIFGTELEGLWHSGIVVNGTEYQFGPSGLWRSFPQQSAFGTPNQVTVLGHTSLAGDDLEDAIRGLVANRYNEDKYDLFFNNGNHFANELALILTGSPLPDFVMNQIQDILATPTGEALLNLLPPSFFPNGHPFTRSSPFAPSHPAAPADPSAPSTSQAPSAAAAADAAMDDDNGTTEDACPAEDAFPELEAFQDVVQLIQDAMRNVFAAGSAACGFAGAPGPFGFPPHSPHGFGGPQGFGPPGHGRHGPHSHGFGPHGHGHGFGPHGHGPHGHGPHGHGPHGHGPHGHGPHGHGPHGHGHGPHGHGPHGPGFGPHGHGFGPHGHGPHGPAYPGGFGGFGFGGPGAFGGFSGFGPGAFGFGGPFGGLAGAARAMATQGGGCMKRRGPCGVGFGGGRGGRGCGAWRGRGAGCRMGMGRGAGCCEAREEACAAAAADAAQPQAGGAAASPSAPATPVDPAAPSTSQQAAAAATRVAADLARVSVSTATDEQPAGPPVPVDWTAGDAQAAAAAQWDMLGMEEVAGARKLE